MNELTEMSKNLAWIIHIMRKKEYISGDHESKLAELYLIQNNVTIALNRIAEEITMQESICF